MLQKTRKQYAHDRLCGIVPNKQSDEKLLDDYLKDKYDNITTKTQDGNDHTIDATRYACEQFWKHSHVSLSNRRIF